MDVEITNKLVDAIKLLREVGQAYANMAEPERKTVRHVAYQRTGALGRAVLADKGKLLLELGKEGKKLEERNV